MATWKRADKPNLRTGLAPAPKKTPRSYESHPGAGARNASGLNVRKTGPGSKSLPKPGVGAKNPDLRAKM